MNATTEEFTEMAVDYEQFLKFSNAMHQMEQFMYAYGTKMPLLLVIEATPEGINVQNVMDVSYESYSIHAEFPTPVLEITYTGVKHLSDDDRFIDVGNMCIKMELLEEGEMRCTEIRKIEYLHRIDTHI